MRLAAAPPSRARVGCSGRAPCPSRLVPSCRGCPRNRASGCPSPAALARPGCRRALPQTAGGRRARRVPAPPHHLPLYCQLFWVHFGFAISSSLNAKFAFGLGGRFILQVDSGVVVVDSGQGRSWGFSGSCGHPLFRNWSVNALTSRLERLKRLSGVWRTKFPL